MGNPGQRISSASDQAEKHGLRILYTNARSIVNKIQELKLHVLDTNPDMITITETWAQQQQHQLAIVERKSGEKKTKKKIDIKSHMGIQNSTAWKQAVAGMFHSLQ